MNQINSKLTATLATFGLVMMTGGTALADDTELFIAGEDNSAGQDAARPNIMFIIDTSGSMDSEVLTQATSYDANQTFEGCYRTDAVYWSFTNSAPSCNSENWFQKSRNYCATAVEDLERDGVYSGNVFEWRQNRRDSTQSRWQNLSTRSELVNRRGNTINRDIECEDDAGEHGDSPGAEWAADGSAGPWAGNDNSEPSWTTNYFLFDGNYMNYVESDGEVESTRIRVVKDVTINLLNSLSNENVNVGLMRFNFEDGGPVIHAMEDIATARDDMIDAVEDLPADGWTPLSETLYEAGQYFAGRSVEYGDGFTVDSVAASRTGGSSSSGTYNSPIDYACQKNYVVLLSDGEPTRDTGAENAIEALPGFSSTVGAACARLPGEDSNNGKCLDEMADYMYNHDLSSEFYGQQNVTTYTIAFAEELPLLQETARRGGGSYYRANNTSTLTDALTRIVVSILDDAATFTAPSVPVNAFNRTQNLEDVFMSVFNPSSSIHWPGNVKKYSLRSGQLIDANEAPAVDPSTGFFYDTAQSFWSTEPDGDRPIDGGAAENLPSYDERKLYTNVAGGLLTSVGNRVIPTNSAITGAALGGATETVLPTFVDTELESFTERELIIDWMRGRDVQDRDGDLDLSDTRRSMGDPMHVRPVPVIYGGSAAEPDMTIYVATNDGYLHAIDPDDGTELWSFIPSRLLGTMRAHFEDPISPTRLYGLDGEITAAILNNDKRGGITGDERVILVFGMRRGGDGYFAIDVTDRENPRQLWEINANTPGFGALGQTWSTPQHKRVRIDGGIRDVVFVGGGYDPGQDNETYRTDAQGNAIYMIDIETGELLWSAGSDNSHDLVLEDMEHSIPAPVRAIDLNGDGLTSRLYFGDMGGRVWRIDLINGNSANEFAEGGVLASLGGAALETPAASDLRRFYNQADVVDVPNGGNRFMAVNIGSGYRAHPLDRGIDEYFFSVRDYAVNRVIETEEYPDAATIDELSLIDPVVGIDMDADTRGWKLALNASAGEKSLSRSITFNGTIFFTSFAPGAGATACTAVAGQNRVYALSLFDGRTVLLDDQPYFELRQGGIAPQVELFGVLEDADGDGKEETTLGMIVGPETPDLGLAADLLSRTYWTQDGAQ